MKYIRPSMWTGSAPMHLTDAWNYLEKKNTESSKIKTWICCLQGTIYIALGIVSNWERIYKGGCA